MELNKEYEIFYVTVNQNISEHSIFVFVFDVLACFQFSSFAL